MGGSFTPTQGNAWQWFTNDAAEPVEPDNQLANENAAPTLPNNTSIIRLRVQITESGGANGSGVWVVQYDRNDSSWVTLGSGNHWNWANGAATEGGTCPPLAVYLLSGSNSTGQYIESPTYSSSVTKNKTNEFDLAIVPTGSVVTSQLYRFRVLTIGGTSVGAPATYPSLTTAAPPPATTGPGWWGSGGHW